MPGIDQLISDRMNAFAGQPQALAQRYAQNQDLLDLLALQKMKSDKASAMRNVQASMQANPTTVRDQLEQETLAQTRQEMADQAMQGAQGMQLNRRRAMQARGIPALPAPNMARMQRYQQGGIVPTESKPTPTMGAVPPSAVGDEQIKQFAKEYMAIKRALEDPRQAEYKERNQLLLQDLISQMGNEMPAVMQYIDSTKGMVEPRGFRDGGVAEYASGSAPVVRSEDPEMLNRGQEDRESTEQSIVDNVIDWAKQNPVDAASVGLAMVPIGGPLVGAGIKATTKAAQFLAPITRKYGTKATEMILSTARSLFTKPKTSGAGSAVRGPGGRMMSAENAAAAGIPLNRAFSPGRAMLTAAGGLQLGQGLASLMGGAGGEEQEAADTQTPTPAPTTAETTTAPAGLEALVDRTTAMPEQFRMEGTEPSGMRTPQDYLASLARQQTRREETQEGAEQPRSRYEEELDRLREEEGDLLGKIAAMAQGIASGRGRSLGQSLAAGSAALTARERDIENRRLNLVEALQNAEITAEEAAREQRRLDILAEQVQVDRAYNDARIASQARVDAFAAQGDIQKARQAALEAAQEITSDLSYRSTIRSMIKGSEEGRGLSESELDSRVQEAIDKEASRLAREFMEQSGLPRLEAAAQRLTPSVSADQFAADMQIK